jgi:hypothetical protein
MKTTAVAFSASEDLADQRPRLGGNPAVITFINNNRAGSDLLCHETLAGSGFFSCS